MMPDLIVLSDDDTPPTRPSVPRKFRPQQGIPGRSRDDPLLIDDVPSPSVPHRSSVNSQRPLSYRHPQQQNNSPSTTSSAFPSTPTQSTPQTTFQTNPSLKSDQSTSSIRPSKLGLTSPSRRKQQPLPNPATIFRKQPPISSIPLTNQVDARSQDTVRKAVVIEEKLKLDQIPSASSSRKALTPPPPKPDTTPDRPKSLAPQIYTDVFADLSSEEENESDYELERNSVGLKASYFEHILKDLLHKVNEFQEYIVRPLLQQSRSDAKSRDLSVIPQPSKNPFGNLPLRATSSTNSGPHIRFQSKNYNSSENLSKQQWNPVSAPIIRTNAPVFCLPDYKSIGNIGQSFLARNVTIAKYLPYAVDDEKESWDQYNQKYEEVKQRYHTYESVSVVLHAQRDCAERVDKWRPWIEKFLDLLDIDLKDLAYFYCMENATEIDWHKAVGFSDVELAEWLQEQQHVCDLCNAWLEEERRTLWQAMKSKPPHLKSLAIAGLACSAFQKILRFSMLCVVMSSIEIKDVLEEENRKIREDHGKSEKICLVCGLHQCSLHGAYLEDPKLPEYHLNQFRDGVKIDDPELKRNTRQMITLPLRPTEEQPKSIKKKKSVNGQRKSRAELTKTELRDVFIPCSHAGRCQDNPACTCFKNKTPCEYFCGCEMACQRRFRGCKCHAGPEGVCLDDWSCECWGNGRECDPWLCHSCGVLEVLDQANKYDEEIRKGRCSNNRMQLQVPARTIKAPSEVQGYGLFAGQNLKKGDFVGEYKGEILGVPESNRRGALYHLLGAEYLFTLGPTQQIDATRFGSKTRYMNNSSVKENVNVAGYVMMCNGVQRVMLHADRDIKAGEELLYNYSYPVSITKNFWERGERPSTQKAAIEGPVAKMATNTKKQQLKPALRRQDNEESDEEDVITDAHVTTVPKRRRKRKHDELQIPELSDTTFSAQSDVESSDIDEQLTSSGDERPVARINRHGLKDGRFGGASQRKAAQTARARRLANENRAM